MELEAAPVLLSTGFQSFTTKSSGTPLTESKKAGLFFQVLWIDSRLLDLSNLKSVLPYSLHVAPESFAIRPGLEPFPGDCTTMVLKEFIPQCKIVPQSILNEATSTLNNYNNWGGKSRG